MFYVKNLHEAQGSRLLSVGFQVSELAALGLKFDLNDHDSTRKRLSEMLLKKPSTLCNSAKSANTIPPTPMPRGFMNRSCCLNGRENDNPQPHDTKLQRLGMRTINKCFNVHGHYRAPIFTAKTVSQRTPPSADSRLQGTKQCASHRAICLH